MAADLSSTKMPFLLVMHGLPASGKSTLARAIVRHNQHVAWLAADTIRDQQHLPDQTLAQLLEIYGHLIQEGIRLIRQGKHVILDATFSHPLYRKALYATPGIELAQLVLLHLATPVAVCRTRTEARVRLADTPQRAHSHRQSLLRALQTGDDLLNHDQERVRFPFVIRLDASLRPARILSCPTQLPPPLQELLLPALLAPEQDEAP